MTCSGKINLNESILNAIRNVKTIFNAQEALVFGSFARGDDTVDSDVDVCFLFERFPMEPLELMFQLRRTIHKTCDDPLDVLVFEVNHFANKSQLTNSFEHTIRKEGKAV